MKPLFGFLLCITLANLICIAQPPAHTYYISINGNDANDGESIQHAWHTIDRVNKTTFAAGDSILFEGGKTFIGNIVIDSIYGNGKNRNIVFSSYGESRAIITAGDGTGMFVRNCSNVTVSKLYFKGSGVNANTGSGISFYSDRTDKNCVNITIDDCIAEGFHQYGILISCAENEATKGFDNVLITNCIATANGEAGIASLGVQTSFHHANFHVTQCKAFLNKGIPTKTDNHSGNGIVMSGIDHLLIDYCQAYENGALNHCTGGGPVGIWMWLCKNAVIEHCESHHNHAGLTKDGGGFDIDGGCSNCVLQYNYSHDNEGAGYLLAEYGAGLPFENNTVRFNISQDDGRKNGYGGIAFWGVNETFKVTNTYVYNNTVFVSDKNIVNGTPAAVMAMGNNLSHVLVANNVFLTDGSARILNSDAKLDTSVIYFLSNDYYSYSGNYLFNCNKAIVKSTGAFVDYNQGQETLNGNSAFSSANPYYINAGGGGVISNIKNMQALLDPYHPKTGGANKGAVDLKKLFSLDIGTHDFYGNTIPKHNFLFRGCVLK